MAKGILVVMFMLAGVLALTQPEKTTSPAAAPLKTVVTIAPLKSLLQPLLPPGSTVTVLMEPGRSEHGYEFSPADMAAVSHADVVVYVGLGLEGRLETILKKQQSPKHIVLSFADAVGIKPGEHREDDEHEKDHHDHAHEHGAGYVDPHLWLDPLLVEKLVPELKSAVAKAEHVTEASNGAPDADAKRLDEAAAKLLADVQAIDKLWTDRLAPLKGKPIVTHHNAFGRPADRYGLKVAAVIKEVETSDPTPGDIQKVIEAIRDQHVKAIFIEPQFNAAAAERISKTANVKLGRLDPLGDGDWFALMRSNLDSLVTNLSDDPAPKPREKK